MHITLFGAIGETGRQGPTAVSWSKASPFVETKA